MYKTAMKKSVLLISLALSAAAPAVDLNQHLSFDYRVPSDGSIGDLRAGLTANACHSLTDPMVIRLSLDNVDWKKYDVNLKINGRDVNAVTTPFKQGTDLVKPFLVSTDNKLKVEFVTAKPEQRSRRVVASLNEDDAYCFTHQANGAEWSVGEYYNTGGYPPYGKGSDDNLDQWQLCKDRVVKAVCGAEGCYYPAGDAIDVYGALGTPLQKRIPIIYEHSNKGAPGGLLRSAYMDDEHFINTQFLMERQLEIARDYLLSPSSQSIAAYNADRFWYKYMFYRKASYGWVTYNGLNDVVTSHAPVLLTDKDADKADKVLKSGVDYTPVLLHTDDYAGERIKNSLLTGVVSYYTSQRNIQSIELTIKRKGTPATDSFTWTRLGKSNVLSLVHSGNLVKPSAKKYDADYYQEKGFYATPPGSTTPGFYRGTLVASAGLNTNYTSNPAPLSRPTGMNGNINLVNTNDLTLVLMKEGDEISAAFYGQPLQFADLKFEGGKIPAKKVRDACY